MTQVVIDNPVLNLPRCAQGHSLQLVSQPRARIAAGSVTVRPPVTDNVPSG